LERSAEEVECLASLISGRESYIMKQFQRRAHHYIKSPPDQSAGAEWLALIQHYGGPTRLLDFTHSFYVAAFFAVERSTTNSAIWCVNATRLDDLSIERRRDETLDDVRQKLVAIANSHLADTVPSSRVIIVDPFRLHERAALQQGCYLFPCDVSKPFETNLYTGLGHSLPVSADRLESEALLKVHDDELSRYDVIKVEVPKLFNLDVLMDLRRMNISSATLFPGLDGYARSLNYHMSTTQVFRRFMLENSISNRAKPPEGHDT
jgi:hypothetical protein